MEHLTVIVEIARVSLLTLCTWILSGIWSDLFLLRQLVPGPVRGSLLLVSGVATHMILTLNLSYLGIEVNRGLWFSLLIVLVPILFRIKQLPTLLPAARHLRPVVLFVFLALSTHTWSLVKERVVTTSPAENGDWLTYVSHADILKDYGFGYTRAQAEYPHHYHHTEQYESANFRYGPSHLLASSSAISGTRAIFIFTIFCGCLLAVLACGMHVFALQLRLGATPSLIVACLFAVHPSVQWVAFAAFMPQLVGISLMLAIFALAPVVISRKPLLITGASLGLFTCALFVGYNELLPITGTVTGLYAISIARLNPSRWKRLLLTGAAVLGTTLFLSPVGVYRGIRGMLLQVQIARSTGGAEQAIQEYLFFFGSWLGLLPLPPLRQFIDTFKADPRYSYVELAVAALLFTSFTLFVFGASRSMRGRRKLLLFYLIVAVGLGSYIQLTFDVPQFRSWASFKLSQYSLPAVSLLIAIGALSLGAPGRIAGAVLTAGVLVQTAYYYGTFPRTPLRENARGAGIGPTIVDIALVNAVKALSPAGSPLLGLNDFSRGRDVGVPLLLYPNRIMENHTDVPNFIASGGRYGVEDKNYGVPPIHKGKVVWENARFRIIELALDGLYLTYGTPSRRLLNPAGEIAAPVCSVGDTVALHGYAVEPGALEASDVSGTPAKVVAIENIRAGEFVLTFPLGCEKGYGRLSLKPSSTIYVADFEIVKTPTRREALESTAKRLRSTIPLPVNLIPVIENNVRWQKRTLDGSSHELDVSIVEGRLQLAADKPTSGALEAAVRLDKGWYTAEVTGEILRAPAGAGRGFGVGLLNDSATQTWVTSEGRFLIRRSFPVATAGPSTFGLVLGGYGTVSGAVRITSAELKANSALTNSSPPAAVELPPFTSPKWSQIAYDGAKSNPVIESTDTQIRLKSPLPTSAGYGTLLDLAAGTYLLSATLDSPIAPSGSGLGYAVLIEGQPASIVSSQQPGTAVTDRIFSIDKAGKYRLSVLIGGYGQSQGEVRVSNLSLARVGERQPPPESAPAENSVLAPLGGNEWQIVPLDPSPGKVSTSKSAGSLRMDSAGPVSAAATSSVVLEPGTYFLSSQILAQKLATGSGKGYGVGFLRNPDWQWYIREPGSHHITALISTETKVNDSLALILGGFGTLEGSVRFEQPILVRLQLDSLAAVK